MGETKKTQENISSLKENCMSFRYKHSYVEERLPCTNFFYKKKVTHFFPCELFFNYNKFKN